VAEGPGGDAEVPQINVLGDEAPTLAQLGDEDKAKLSDFRKLVEVKGGGQGETREGEREEEEEEEEQPLDT